MLSDKLIAFTFVYNASGPLSTLNSTRLNQLYSNTDLEFRSN
jgi:hypothetical protein